MINDFTAFTLNQTAKLLNLGVGRTNLMKLLRDEGFVLKDNSPSQSMVDKGYLIYHLKEIKRKKKPVMTLVTLVTIKGLAFLEKHFKTSFQTKLVWPAVKNPVNQVTS